MHAVEKFEDFLDRARRVVECDLSARTEGEQARIMAAAERFRQQSEPAR